MRKDPFFVGYARMPGELRRVFWILGPLTVLISLAVAVLLGLATPDAGTGQWDTNAMTRLSGRLSLDPYPMLIPDGKRQRPVLLVSGAKLSARPFLKAHDQQYIEVTGNLVQRGPWRMLTIDAGDQVRTRPGTAPDMPKPVLRGAVNLKGEVVDSKCMLGAMKPGEGTVHRACASLCLLGGMPPMLLVRGAGGGKVAYLLVGGEGQAVHEAMAAIVAEPVEISGIVEAWAGMPVLRMAGAPQRLKGPDLLAFGPSIGVGDSAVFCRVRG